MRQSAAFGVSEIAKILPGKASDVLNLLTPRLCDKDSRIRATTITGISEVAKIPPQKASEAFEMLFPSLQVSTTSVGQEAIRAIQSLACLSIDWFHSMAQTEEKMKIRRFSASLSAKKLFDGFPLEYALDLYLNHSDELGTFFKKFFRFNCRYLLQNVLSFSEHSSGGSSVLVFFGNSGQREWCAPSQKIQRLVSFLRENVFERFPLLSMCSDRFENQES